MQQLPVFMGEISINELKSGFKIDFLFMVARKQRR